MSLKYSLSQQAGPGVNTGRKMLLNFVDLLLKVKTFENIKLKVKFALNNKTFFNTETVYFLTIFLYFFL